MTNAARVYTVYKANCGGHIRIPCLVCHQMIETDEDHYCVTPSREGRGDICRTCAIAVAVSGEM